jgi:hypothetical protein
VKHLFRRRLDGCPPPFEGGREVGRRLPCY